MRRFRSCVRTRTQAGVYASIYEYVGLARYPIWLRPSQVSTTVKFFFCYELEKWIGGALRSFFLPSSSLLFSFFSAFRSLARTASCVALPAAVDRYMNRSGPNFFCSGGGGICSFQQGQQQQQQEPSSSSSSMGNGIGTVVSSQQ